MEEKIELPPHLSKRLVGNNDTKEKKAKAASYVTKLDQLKKDIVQILDRDDKDSSILCSLVNEFQKLLDENINRLSNYDIQVYQKFLKKTQSYIHQDNIPVNVKLDQPDSQFSKKLFRKDGCKILQSEELFENVKSTKPYLLKDLSNQKSQPLNNHLIFDNLTDCTINLTYVIPELKILRCKNCVIKCGLIQTFVFIDDCHHTEISLVCRQLRIHNSKNLIIGVLVYNRIVIENCKEIVILKYVPFYPEFDEQISISGLNLLDCDWKNVDDFDWINPFDPSPNFTIIT